MAAHIQLDAPETRPIVVLAASQAAIITLAIGVLAWRYPEQRGWLLMLWLVAVLAIGGCTLWWLRRVVARLSLISDQLRAARLNQADYHMALNDEGWFSTLHNELYHYVRQTTALRADLDRDRQQLTQAITDIAHQLRTPIAVTQNLLELLTPANTVASRATLLKQNQRLTTLVGELILLARVDTHTLSQQKTPVALADLLQQSLNPLLPLIADAGLQLDFQVPDKIQLQVNTELMQEALINVLKNACEHATLQSVVQIYASQTPLSTVLMVTNHGPLIAQADLPHLFERFYRGADSAPNNLGVGLAIASGIMNAASGRINIANVEAGVQYRLEWFT
ncbi:sensor histidine kinase [Lacticaseibacillus nasuensis]|uniref:sensor histidine kinase n=1 Tax=Lacticaseibacillus nasuensis TaxID=944671 RepID=UPI0022475C70|nr:HAMP domain-containing sensor histidine kinase [Lacticaseibacillus nasuensis]MCX2454639.1 HAMP domain-containing histidine kinase [Lacticaseibacillus nasuensis]